MDCGWWYLQELPCDTRPKISHEACISRLTMRLVVQAYGTVN